MAVRVRARILDFVGTSPGASTGQIARALGMKAAAVRHHLGILVGDNRLEVVPVPLSVSTKRRGRGRPERHYRITRGRPENNLAMISAALLHAWTSVGRGRRLPEVAEVLSRYLIRQVGLPESRVPSHTRIAAMVQRLNRLHYAAHWEAGAAGPRVILGHCPYAAIIADHPELCRMDAAALSHSVGWQPRQIAKIDPSSAAETQCIFVLR